MARTLASGALRCGQWPMLSMMRRVEPGMAWCMNLPTVSSNQVVAALKNQGGDSDLHHLGAMVGQKRHASELLRHLRVGLAETAGQFLAQLGPVGFPMITGAICADQPR